MSTAHAITGFNAFRFQQRLKQANIPTDQADALAAAFEEGMVSDTSNLATSLDISRLEGKIASLEGKLTILMWGIGIGATGTIGLLIAILNRLPS